MEMQGEVTTAATQSPQSQKKRGRRGKQSRAKAAEKSRTHLNDTAGAQFISARIAQFKLENALTPEELFGPMSTNIPVTKPPLSISISTHQALQVAELTVRTLIDACKVPTSDLASDIETVQLITSLQVFAKLYYSQRNTPFQIVSATDDSLAEQVLRNANQAILPIAVYVDQIGRFEIDGQQFIPVEEQAQDGYLYSFSFSNLKHPSLKTVSALRYLDIEVRDVNGTIYDRTRMVDLHSLGPNGGNMYIELQNIDQAIALNIISADRVVNQTVVGQVFPPGVARYVEAWMSHPIPPVNDIFQRYTEFLARVQKKVGPDRVPQMSMARGIGTDAQLVFSSVWVNDFRTVYCARPVSSDSLFLGAAFELNIIEQPLTDPLACSVSSIICSRNAIPRLMQCLTKRVGSQRT